VCVGRCVFEGVIRKIACERKRESGERSKREKREKDYAGRGDAWHATPVFCAEEKAPSTHPHTSSCTQVVLS